jgi:hypothetical protein
MYHTPKNNIVCHRLTYKNERIIKNHFLKKAKYDKIKNGIGENARSLCREQLVCAADETAGPGQGKESHMSSFFKNYRLCLKLSSLETIS